MYLPVRTKQSARIQRMNTVTPYEGENMREFSALLKPSQALKIVNYIPDSAGKLRMRKGLKRIYEVAGTNPVTLLQEFTNDILIFAYAQTVAAYTISTDTITTIKNDWTANGTFCGARYGEFFFVSNGIERIWRINTSLVETEIAASPPSTSLTVLGNRLVSAFGTSIQYSEVDTGSNPPFTSWTNASTATAGGIVSYRNAGNINTVVTFGDIIVAFAEFGKWAFRITQIDLGGTLSKKDDVVIDRQDLGGESALVTDKGIYYTNSAGIWLLVALGQENVPFSDQEFKISHVLGADYFEKINFSGSTMAYNDADEMLYVSCRRQSAVNNFVIAVNTAGKYPSFARFTNWNIGVFMTDHENVLWGGSSVNTRVYQCLTNYTDDGANIGTEYYQELNIGDPEVAKSLLKFAAVAEMSSLSQLQFSFDVFNLEGVFQPNKFSYCMDATNKQISQGGYGRAPYGSGYGEASGGAENGMVSQYDSFKPFIRNFQRIRMRITSSSNSPHIINTVSATIKEKSEIRRRKITVC